MALDPDTLETLIETVAKFVDERLIPLEAQVAAEDKIPDTVISEMAELGLFGLTIPVEYGGLGLKLLLQLVLQLLSQRLLKRPGHNGDPSSGLTGHTPPTAAPRSQTPYYPALWEPACRAGC